jgi:hypothetical protein
MTPRELRRELRQRREELRRSLTRMRQQARERVRQHPEVRRERKRRHVRRAVLVALLLLACLMRCECQQGPPPVQAVVRETPEVKPKTPLPAPPPRREPLRVQVKPQSRGSYLGEAQAPPTWLDAFRLQVSARGPRLAQCFTGTDRPGVLRWTASVNPESGAVADHELEPLGPGAELKREQRDCVVRVLSSPTYRLSAPRAQVLPNRISLVIEF